LEAEARGAELVALTEPPGPGDPPEGRGRAVSAATRRAGIETVVDATDRQSFAGLLTQLAKNRVVFVGETHDRYDHHLNQLAVIRGLHRRGVDLAVAMEFFQEPFQRYLDEFVAGEIGEKELLRKTRYYERWRYDYRLYRDILNYAREHNIPLVALNAPTELVTRVSKDGFAGLSSQERARLPEDLPVPSAAYADRLRPIFEMHGEMADDRLQRFVEVQMLWDEHMARGSRDFLRENPDKTLVILAGSGHVAYPDAIPGRLDRMIKAQQTVVVTGDVEDLADGAVDFVIAERNIELEPPGRLGMRLAEDGAAIEIREVTPASPAATAGFLPGDLIHSIAGEPTRDMQDVRLALLDRARGEKVWIEVGSGGEEDRTQPLRRSLMLM
jgi:uncharacterized iron-regulated protein